MNSTRRMNRLAWVFSMTMGCALLASAWSSARANVVPAARWRSFPAVPPQSPVPRTSEPVSEANICGHLVDAISLIESAGNPSRVGRNGERGLMQVKRETWDTVTATLYGQTLPFDRAFEPELNRRVGEAYLRELQAFLRANRGLWKTDERQLLLACYNAGPGRVSRSGFDLRGLPASTQDYVQRVSALHDALRQG